MQKDGVRQGGVISVILYCFYGNQLFDLLQRSEYCCFFNGLQHGIFGYLDDNLLLAPSEYALKKMMKMCEQFANDHNLQFSTDPNPTKCKTRCIEGQLCGNIQGSRKLVPLVPPIPDKPNLVGENEIKMKKKNWPYYSNSEEILSYSEKSDIWISNM